MIKNNAKCIDMHSKECDNSTNKQTNKQRYTIPCERGCGYLVVTASLRRKGAMA